MKRREFLRSAAMVAATSGFAPAALAKSAASDEAQTEKKDSKLIDSEPFLQNYAATSMGIAFSVTGLANGYVIYGEKPDLSDGTKVWCGGFRVTDMDDEIIRVRLTGLKPYTLYYYRIGADRIEYKDGYHIRVLGNEESERIYSFRTAGEEAPAHFSVINDTHMQWKCFSAVTDKIAELKPECVIWNGDACDRLENVAAQKQAFLKPKIDRKDYAANIPYLFCPGNHDNRGLANRHPERVWMFRQPEERQSRDWDLGRNFAVRMGDVAMIGLDTAEDKVDTNPLFCNLFVSDSYRKAQKLWLADALRRPEIKSAPFLVTFCHIPLFDPRPNVNPGDIYPADKAEGFTPDFAVWQRTCAQLWLPLLEEAGCQLIITGHQHAYRADLPDEKRAWTQLVGGSPDMDGKNDSHYPTVMDGYVKDGKLVVDVHNIFAGKLQATHSFLPRSKRRRRK